MNGGTSEASESYGFMNIAGQIVVVSDYLYEPGAPLISDNELEEAVSALAVSGQAKELLRQLSVLAHFSHKESDGVDVVRQFSDSLAPDIRARFDAMPIRNKFFATQPVMKAMSRVFQGINSDRKRTDLSAQQVAIFLVHSIGEQLQREERSNTSGRTIGGLDEDLVLIVVASTSLHYSQLPNVMLQRQELLWDHYGHLAQKYLGRSASALLLEATGLELMEILSLGSLLNVASANWRLYGGNFARLGEGLGISRDKVSKFELLVSMTPAEFQRQLGAATITSWDLGVFEEHPVVRYYEHLLVLDESLMWRRITTGLYWYVFDYIKRTEGDDGRRNWTQAWGEIVEEAAKDLLVPFAMEDHDGNKMFWSEEDLETTYGKGVKHADLVLVTGKCLLLVEIVSGLLTTGTRSRLERASFDGDMQKLFTKKARQLEDTVVCIESNARALLGFDLPSDWVVLPIVVSAFGFPYFKPVITHLRDIASAEKLLQSTRIESFSMLDLREIELLESVVEHGEEVDQVLQDWRIEAGDEVTFWNWYTKKHYGEAVIPTRLQEGGGVQVRRLIATLRGDIEIDE